MEEAFSCPICYSDGINSGLVIPSSCEHKLCLSCYSNILKITECYKCPMCRVPYKINFPIKERKIYLNVKIWCFRWHINLFRLRLI